MGPRLFLLDNYDSFTYNLAQYMMEQGARVDVRRNDRVSVREVLDGGCDGIVISPGPGRPGNAGITKELIAEASGRVPLLGVCLGHQALAEVLGARIGRAARLMHGKTSMIRHDGRGVFEGLANPFEATRYHSLLIESGSVPPSLEVSAWTYDGEDRVIMGLRHRDYPRIHQEGVQFHPESILTGEGKSLISNFVRQAARHAARSAPAGLQEGVGG